MIGMCEHLFDGVSQPIHTCENCGKKFEGKGNYCSPECEYANDDDGWDPRNDD